MGKRINVHLVAALCLMLTAIVGCSTAPHRVEPSQAALDQHGVGTGDVVVVQYDSRRDPRNSGRSEEVRIEGIDQMGISGTDPSGKEITIDFGQMSHIQHVDTGPKTTSARGASCPAVTAETRSTLLVNTVAVAACFVLMFHGVACY